ncbi:MAG: C40 family peptidase [Desulfobacterales bacterium]|nr:C40 family peptidase [Desulfobacterales bacterium]
MKKNTIIFLFIIILPVLGGCSSKESTKAQPFEKDSSQRVSNNSIREILLKEFQQWEGTPHKMGGNSKKGIDCSGFAHYMYVKLFNIKVPRSTRLFLKEGVKIKKSQLSPGDLVIFRPPSYPRHIGIYVGDNKFIHASTSKGVMMSDLNNPYWLKCYYMSRRIIKKTS